MPRARPGGRADATADRDPAREFLTWNQAHAGGSPTPSAGKQFNAYVLRPTGDAPTSTRSSSPVTSRPCPLSPILAVSAHGDLPGRPTSPVQAGDMIGFYGSGHPGRHRAPAPTSSATRHRPRPPRARRSPCGSPELPALRPGPRPTPSAPRVLDNSGVTPLTAAKATAYGSVDAITLGNPGAGYSFPTVDIDFPDGPDGVQATAHAVCVETDCAPATDGATVTITGIAWTTRAPATRRLRTSSSATARWPTRSILPRVSWPPRQRRPSRSARSSSTIPATATSRPRPSTINDPSAGTGATATATVNAGAVTGLTLTAAGSGYITPGIKKFEDALPALCNPVPLAPTPGTAPTTRQVHPARRPRGRRRTPGSRPTSTSSAWSSTGRRSRPGLPRPPSSAATSSSRPPTTPTSASTSRSTNELSTGTKVPVLINGAQAYAVTPPQWLGPTIAATKDKPVRIVFHNLLPDGFRRRPVPADRLHTDGLGHGPDGHAHATPDGRRVGQRRRAQPDVLRVPEGRRTASRTTGRPCTCTAASPRGSATGPRTSGSPRPMRPPR